MPSKKSQLKRSITAMMKKKDLFRIVAALVIGSLIFSNHLLHSSSSSRASSAVVVRFPLPPEVVHNGEYHHSNAPAAPHGGDSDATNNDLHSGAVPHVSHVELSKPVPAEDIERRPAVIPAVNGNVFVSKSQCSAGGVSHWASTDGGCRISSSVGDKRSAELLGAFFAQGVAQAASEDFAEVLSNGDPSLGNFKFHAAVNDNQINANGCHVVLVAAPSDKLEDTEGYGLRIEPAQITVAASTPKGALYGLYTLLSIATSSPIRNALPCISIDWDAPKKSWRGQHFDTARHFFDLTYLKSVVRRIARLKLNKLHLHLTDEQGWRLESKVFSELHRVGSTRGATLNGHKFKKYSGRAYAVPTFHTHAEIRHLQAYAAARGVELVPEIDLPGHAYALVNALASRQPPVVIGRVLPASRGNEDCENVGPEYRGALNCMGGVFGLVDPTSAALEILTKIIREVAEVFDRSTHIHLGADEAEFARDQLWGGQTFDGVAVKDTGALQSQFMDKLIRVVHSLNRTAVVWDEAVLEAPSNYLPPAPTKVMLWRDDRKSLKDLLNVFRLRGRQLPVIFTPKTRLYFDYIQHAKLSANRYGAMQRPPPWAKHKAVTLKRALQTHLLDEDFVEGYESCLWTELVTSTAIADYQLFPRVFATADVGWSRLPLSMSSPTPETISELAKYQAHFEQKVVAFHPFFSSEQL